MHIWMELYMWEKRYRQFQDKKWNRTCGKRGTNQKVEPYMWENVSPSPSPLQIETINFGHKSLPIILGPQCYYLLCVDEESNTFVLGGLKSYNLMYY